MKLYTEEQVKIAMRLVVLSETTFYEALKLLTPIELPSDEEIKKGAEWLIGIENLSFREGAKWTKDKIQGGNK